MTDFETKLQFNLNFLIQSATEFIQSENENLTDNENFKTFKSKFEKVLEIYENDKRNYFNENE